MTHVKEEGDDNEEEKVFQLNVNILLMYSLNALIFTLQAAPIISRHERVILGVSL